MAYLVEDLLESVKSRSFVPISQTTFQDADLISILNEELRLKLVADLIKVREDFFLWRKSASLISGKSLYDIPYNAVGSAIKALFYVSPSGDMRMLTRKDVDQLPAFGFQADNPVHFYFEGDQVGLYPYPATSAGSLIFVFPRKPNRLCETSLCTKITAVSENAGTVTFTVDTDQSQSWTVGTLVDFNKGNGFSLHAENVPITLVNTTTIEVDTTRVDDVDGSVLPGVGDYICPAGYSNIAMTPEEFVSVLAQMGSVRLLASMGDVNKWNAAKLELKEMRDEALKLVKNRAESAPDKVTAKNPLLIAFRRSW